MGQTSTLNQVLVMSNSDIDPEQVELKISAHDIETAENNNKSKIEEINAADRPLTKEELEQLADTPFWQRIRWATIVFFWSVWICMLGLTIYIVMNAKADISQKERALVLDQNFEAASNEAIVVYDKLPQKVDEEVMVVISSSAEVDFSKLTTKHYFDSKNSEDAKETSGNQYYSTIDEELLLGKLGDVKNCENVKFTEDNGLVVHDSDEVSSKMMLSARFGKLFVTKNKENILKDAVPEFTCEKLSECPDGNDSNECFRFDFGGKIFDVS